jgi:hypothetical protein
MRRIVLGPEPSPYPPARWHDCYDEPCGGQAIEVDMGDWCVWAGVRYAPELEAFVDEDSGLPVSVVMWRYAARALA